MLDSRGKHQRLIAFQSKERNITAYIYSYKPCLSHTVFEDVNFFYKVKNNHTILEFRWTIVLVDYDLVVDRAFKLQTNTTKTEKREIQASNKLY